MFNRWNLLLIFLCCFAVPASTVSTSCGPTVTGTNISSYCSGAIPAAASLSTSTSETTASVSAAGGFHRMGMSLAAMASFTVDEMWLILGGTGSAELMYNGLPLFLTMSAGPPGDPDGDAVIDISGLNIGDGNITGLEFGRPIDFTFGVPFSFVANVSLFADDDYGDGGYASIMYETGTQTYTIPNEDTVNFCAICPNHDSPWGIYQPGGNFEGATLIRTGFDTSSPEPSFGGPS